MKNMEEHERRRRLKYLVITNSNQLLSIAHLVISKSDWETAETKWNLIDRIYLSDSCTLYCIDPSLSIRRTTEKTKKKKINY